MSGGAIEVVAGKAAEGRPPVANLVAFHQVVSQSAFRMMPDLTHEMAGIAVMKVVYPATQTAVHISHHVFQWYHGQFTLRLFRQPRLDLRQRFVRRPDIRVWLAAVPRRS